MGDVLDTNYERIPHQKPAVVAGSEGSDRELSKQIAVLAVYTLTGASCGALFGSIGGVPGMVVGGGLGAMCGAIAGLLILLLAFDSRQPNPEYDPPGGGP